MAHRFFENLCSPGLIGCLKPWIMEMEVYTRERSKNFSLSVGEGKEREEVWTCEILP